MDNARLDNSRADNHKGDNGEDKAEPVIERAPRGAPPTGVDVAAIKRELRAVLDQLQR